MKDTFESLQILLQRMVIDEVFPGATFSLVNNEEEYMTAVGYKSLIPTKELTYLDTLYDMASLTKVIVTNTILTRAVQSKKISLNDRIGIYLKGRYTNSIITIYDLATHSSGLPADLDTSNINSNDDVDNQLNDIKMQYQTGKDAIYSDPGFILLGNILEIVYNKPLDVIANEEVFIPLDMTNSTYYPIKEKCAPTELTEKRGLIIGKTHDEKSYYSNKILGHAGLFSNITDVNKFMKMVLNDGKVGNATYLSKELIDLWFKPFTIESDGTKRSIGWISGNTLNLTNNSCSDNTISHSGFTGTSIVIDRDRNIGVCLLSNRVHPTRLNRKLITMRKEIIKHVINSKVPDKTKII